MHVKTYYHQNDLYVQYFRVNFALALNASRLYINLMYLGITHKMTYVT